MCPLQRAPSGASSLSQFPLLGLTFAQALSRPLSPDFTPPPPALTPPELGSPHAGQAQGRLPAPQRRTSSSAAHPLPGSGSPRAHPQHQSRTPGPSRPRSPRRPSPPPSPALRPLGGYQLVPPARRRRRTANRRLPHCGPSRAGGLGPPAAGLSGPDARTQAEDSWFPPGLRSPPPNPDPPGRRRLT